MVCAKAAGCHDEPAIRLAGEFSNAAFDLGSVTRADDAQLQANRRHGLDRRELADPGGRRSGPQHRDPCHAWRNLFEQIKPFALMLYSNVRNPVTFPPGRARFLTRPDPTGSMICVKTIGTVRDAFCSSTNRVSGDGQHNIRSGRDQFGGMFAKVPRQWHCSPAPRRCGRFCPSAQPRRLQGSAGKIARRAYPFRIDLSAVFISTPMRRTRSPLLRRARTATPLLRHRVAP